MGVTGELLCKKLLREFHFPKRFKFYLKFKHIKLKSEFLREILFSRLFRFQDCFNVNFKIKEVFHIPDCFKIDLEICFLSLIIDFKFHNSKFKFHFCQL